jgi:hypothetical protein
MFFGKDKSLQEIQNWINTQLSVVHPVAKEGLDVIIKPHKSWRSNEQNRFLMVIMQKIVIFYHETGFMPAGCQKWMMRVDLQKEYWKARFGIEHTRTLDKKQFGDFIDGIQRELVEETNGEWEIIETDSAYLLSLVGEL